MQNNHAHVVAAGAIERASSSGPGHGGTGSDLSQEASQDQRREEKGGKCSNVGGGDCQKAGETVWFLKAPPQSS